VSVIGPGSIIVAIWEGCAVMPTGAAGMWAVKDDMIDDEGANRRN